MKRMVFRIKEGKVNDIDLAGITVIYLGDILTIKIAAGSGPTSFLRDRHTKITILSNPFSKSNANLTGWCSLKRWEVIWGYQFKKRSFTGGSS